MALLPAEFLSRMTPRDMLPEPLPAAPFALFQSWFDEAVASKSQPNPNSMTLATVDARGWPGARVVLCRGIDVVSGRIVFYTNYNGAKGCALDANPRAAVVFHWDHLDRQVRMEGPVTKSPATESDAYFRSRPWESRLSAWASRQSEVVRDRGQLLRQLEETIARLNLDPAELLRQGNASEIPRPPNWGGFRLWAEKVELWLGGPGRLHDRAVWERHLARSGEEFVGGPWASTRLQP